MKTREEEKGVLVAPPVRKLDPVDLITPTTPGRSYCALGGKWIRVRYLSDKRILEILTSGRLVSEAPGEM